MGLPTEESMGKRVNFIHWVPKKERCRRKNITQTQGSAGGRGKVSYGQFLGGEREAGWGGAIQAPVSERGVKR